MNAYTHMVGRWLNACVIVALALALPWLGLVTPAQSAGPVITVTTTADDLTVNGNCTLREAIQAVNTGSAVDACPAGAGDDTTIQLGEGTYKLSIPGVAENGNQTGDLDLLKSVNLVGAATDKTILDADHIDRVLDIYNPEASVSLSQLTIQNGSLTDYPQDLLTATAYPSYPVDIPQVEPSDWFGKGGGVRNFGSLSVDHVLVTKNLVDEPVRGTGAGFYNFGTLMLQDSTLSDNNSAYTGGGIASSGTLYLTNVLFYMNYGYAAAELEVAGQSATGQWATGSVVNSEFYASRCSSPSGGAMILGEGAALTIKNSNISYAQCSTEVISSSGNLTLQNVHLSFGSGDEAVINQHANKLVILNSIIDNSGVNSDLPGGVVAVTGGEARIEQSTLTRNSGRVIGVTGGAVEVINSTLGGNTATGIQVSSGSLSLESVTMANNQAGAGSLVVTGGTVTIHNSLIANNHNEAGEGFDCQLAAGTTTSAGYNLVSVTDGCGWIKATGDQTGTRAHPVDPLLLPLMQGDGEVTLTMGLQAGSPARDKADPSHYPPIDQRGAIRPIGARADIGAYEARLSGEEIFSNRLYLPVMLK